MTESGYNGWRNYATWAVALHINNDQGAQSIVEEWAQECWNDAEACKTFTREENAAHALGDRIEEWVGEQISEAMDEIKHSPWARMLITDLTDTGAHYYEIATTFLAEVDKDEDEDA